MYKKEIDVNEVIAFLETCDTDTRVYIGCDSERLKVGEQWYADYITAVVVHINGNQGCKIFGAVARERDYEQHVNKPRMRLMTEVYKIAEMYLKLSAVVAHDIEVHLDINPNDQHNSSIVVNEAVGYIRGMCNVIPMTKPNAWAASYAADRFKGMVEYRRQMTGT
jgi:hypothetical protein